MESVRHVLFEDPLPVYLALAVAEAVVAAFWRGRRTRRWALALLAAPLLAGAVALTAWAVETDREQIHAALHEIAAGVRVGDFAPAERRLDPDCRMPAGGRVVVGADKLIALGRAARTRHGVADVAIAGVNLTLDGESARTRLITTVTLRTGERLLLRWALAWAKRPAGWRIVRVELTGPEGIAEWAF